MNNYDELRQRHKPTHFFEALCMVEHEPWPCSTIRLLDENAALKEWRQTVGCGQGCKCNDGDGEEWCVGTCQLRAENAALRAEIEELLPYDAEYLAWRNRVSRALGDAS